MTVPIDPYHRFLGIPPHPQPPNGYRLLGLELFESNPEVIEAAADRQIAHVRKYEDGPHAAEAQKLLAELARARVCLLLPERKAVYDAALRKKIAEARASKAASPPIAGVSSSSHSENEGRNRHANPPAINSAAPAQAMPNRAVVPSRPRPAASVSGKPAPTAAPRTVASPPSSDLYSPIDPLTYEPPYLRENRRRFFETLLKAAILIFVLAILFILFNALVLPWLKDSFSAPATNPEKKAAVPSVEDKPSSLPEILPPPPEDDASDVGDISTSLEVPAENFEEAETAPKAVSIFKTIRTAFQNHEIRRTSYLGAVTENAFEDQYRDGGLLVALKMTWKKIGKNGESRAVASIQPEYWTSIGYVKGKIHGEPQKNGLRFLAKSGYAIGALKINYAPGGPNQHGRLIGVRIVFMRREEDRLNPQDFYLSSSFPLNSSVPLNAPEIGGNGALAVGIYGSTSEEDIVSLGLSVLKTKTPPPISTRSNPAPSTSIDAACSAKSFASSEGEDDFVGSWHIYEEGRFTSTVVLAKNRTARDSRYHRDGGKWERKKEQVRILWKDGWKDVIEREGDKFRKYSFAPSDPHEHIPTNEGTAVKSTEVIGE